MPDTPAPVEFRGYFQSANDLSFSLSYPNQQKSFWIELGQWRNGVEAVAFDVATTVLSVKINGQIFGLQLEEAREPVGNGSTAYAPDASGLSQLSTDLQTTRPPRPNLEILAERRQSRFVAAANNTSSVSSIGERNLRINESSEYRRTNQGSATQAATTPDSANSDSGFASEGTLDLVRQDQTLRLRATADGTYRGRYTVRSPRREPSVNGN